MAAHVFVPNCVGNLNLMFSILQRIIYFIYEINGLRGPYQFLDVHVEVLMLSFIINLACFMGLFIYYYKLVVEIYVSIFEGYVHYLFAL